MELFISKLISGSITSFSVFIFLLIIWYIFGRKNKRFVDWIGIKGFENKNNIYFWILFATIVFILMGRLVTYIVKDVETAISIFRGLKFVAIPSIFIYATICTAIPEELMFRGFVLKRLNNKFNFIVANIIQSIIFGSIHGLAFVSIIGVFKAIILFVFTGLIAFIMGYINEKKAEGSILPSVIIHSFVNIFAGICSAWILF